MSYQIKTACKEKVNLKIKDNAAVMSWLNTK